MLVVDRTVGNVRRDPALRDLHERLLARDGVETLRLSRWEAHKSRLRRATDRGREIALNLERGQGLQSGDVLHLEADGSAMVVVEVERQRVLEVEILSPGSADEAIERAVRVGHVLGNQHWPVKVEGRRVLVPVLVDEKVMETVLATHGIPGIRYRFCEADESMELPSSWAGLDPSHLHGSPHGTAGPHG